MTTADDAIGSDLPAMSADQEAAFQAEETAANQARASAKGAGHQRLTPDTDDDGGEPAAPSPKPAAATTPSPSPAPTAAPAAAPAAEPDDDVPEAVADDQGRKFVPLATFVAQRKSLQGQIKDQGAMLEEGNKRLNTLLEIANRVQPPAKAAEAAPPAPVVETNPHDKTTHPLEFLEWKADKAERDLKAVTDWRAAQETSSAQSKALTEARIAYVQMHRGFEAQNPTYKDAYQYVMDTWTKVNEATGMTKAEAIQAAEQLEWQTVQGAVTRNQHPSQTIMNIAKAAGWNPAAPGAAAGDAAPAPAATPSPAAQIKLAQAGAAAAVSLSDAAGGAAPQAMNLAQLTALPKEEFYAKFSGANGEAEFRKLAMGRKSSLVA